MDSDAVFLPSDQLISHIRHGRMVLLWIDNSEGGATGIVVLSAEVCEPEHITFMARQARGLVCLGLTREHCNRLNLPLMVEGEQEAAPFTLSIEAREGIDTGISAADRARTVRVAVAPESTAHDLVQPGHIFPVAAAEGGILTRVDSAESATDLARLAGMTPAAVYTEVLDEQGNIAQGEALMRFAAEHALPVGRVSDLVTYRLANERTVERMREGEINTACGPMRMVVYRETSGGGAHLALTCGEITSSEPTLVRVHTASALRDLVGTTLPGQTSWRFDSSLKAIAASSGGVLVLIAKTETPEELLAGVDRLMDATVQEFPAASDAYATVGLGAQILNDLGVGKIRLLGAPVKYNALAGFGLEVCDFVAPE